MLESVAAARARGAKILALLTGLGESVDPFHRTRGNPDGMPVVAAMTRAIADAGLAPDAIDYVNAHGTSTPENDRAECLALTNVMGAHVRRLAVSSNKSMIGHTLSAAGAIEAAFTVLTLQHQRLPPTINYVRPIRNPARRRYVARDATISARAGPLVLIWRWNVAGDQTP